MLILGILLVVPCHSSVILFKIGIYAFHQDFSKHSAVSISFAILHLIQLVAIQNGMIQFRLLTECLLLLGCSDDWK